MIASGSPTVWGIDISTKQIDIAFVTAEGVWQTNAAVLPKTKVDDVGSRLFAAWTTIARFADAMRDHFPPVYVMLERPTGKFQSPSLMMTAGVVAGAVASQVEVPMDFIAVSSWKAAIGLGGNASKAAVRQWAENLGGSIASQDAADALGIASAAACRVDGWAATCYVDPPNYG